MATPERFDTLYPAEWTGAIQHIKVTDEDNFPNKVLDIDKDWKVYVKWEIESKFPNIADVDGSWDVTFFVESVGTKKGTGLEGEVASGNVLFRDDKLPVSTPTHFEWEIELTIPAGTIDAEGVYMLTSLIQYKNYAGKPMEMAAFTERPLITFYKTS